MTGHRCRISLLPHCILAISTAFWMLAGLVGPARATASAATPTIEQLEAALLITMARFVEWPSSAFPSSSAPIVFATVSDDAVAEALAATSAGRNINGHAVVAKRLQWDSDMAGVHLLFVGQVERRRVEVLLERVRRKPILTVSTLPQFASAGGMITVASNDGRVSFSVGARGADDTGLRLSSLLLSHATRVSHESGPGVP